MPPTLIFDITTRSEKRTALFRDDQARLGRTEPGSYARDHLILARMIQAVILVPLSCLEVPL